MTPEQRSALIAIEAAQAAISEAVRVLRASLEAAPPEPPAPEPPAPEPPPTSGIEARAISMAAVVSIDLWHTESRYERFQRLTKLVGNTARIRLRGFNLANGGSLRPLSGTRYGLLVDGVERASLDVPPGTRETWFTLSLADIPAGWHRLELTGLVNETAPVWFAYKEGRNPESMPVLSGSYDLTHETKGTQFVAMVPAQYKPTVVPLVPRQTPDVPTPSRRVLFATDLVPWRDANVFRPSRLKDGALCAIASQSYTVEEMLGKLPRQAPLLDGPRGAGTVAYATHLQVGRGGKVYFCDPWRVGKILADGTVVTLAGYRHKTPRNHWEDTPDLDLVGDWSAIPAERRGFHELWGLAWDERTLAVDEAADPIPSEGNEKPHVVGPVAFVADSQNNRVCRLEWERDKHGPAKVTEFLTDLRDPWDVLCVDGELYVSERLSHRIAVYDATTGAYLRTLVQGAQVSSIDGRRAVTGPSLDLVRAQDCQGPEGLYHLDGWIYWGSNAATQVRRIKTDGTGLEVVCQWTRDTNTKFAKIAVSDGSFGPRGSVAVSTWTNGRFGLPYLFSGGKEIDLRGVDGVGPGRRWNSWGYGTACAIGGGKLIFSTMTEGVIQLSAALPTDKTATVEEWLRATNAWNSSGLYMLHGTGGFGFFGLPLPWGKPEIDAYLTWHGHTRQGNA